nr:excinuclease ABC subunit UvrA [Roseimaritima sediminicola]
MPKPSCSAPTIRLRGVRVHNLRDLDIDLPRGRQIVVCGVSGSGKTSLALDTLYAEGQRRYIESFSAYTRQFLQRLDKPDCDKIEGIPPAIAVTRAGAVRGNRSTVATATEIADHLRLLFARIARLVCYQCGQAVRTFDPQSAAAAVGELPPGTRAMIGFAIELPSASEASEILLGLQQQGYVRLILGDRSYHLGDADRSELAAAIAGGETNGFVVVDRVTSDGDPLRLTESMETAMAAGQSLAILWAASDQPLAGAAAEVEIDGRTWQRFEFSARHRCDVCDLEYPQPQPRLFSFNNPLGACPRCEGFGDQVDIDMDLVVPDADKTIREGAIAVWNTPAYRHEWKELVALAKDYNVPLDVPYRKLPAAARKIIQHGVPERSFGGLDGFFAWLERKKYKMHVRVFLSRFRSYTRCGECQGQRLKPAALAYQIAGQNIAQVSELRVDQAIEFFDNLSLDQRQATIAAEMLRQVLDRLRYLQDVGLGYLQLERTLRTLSGGESQRVALTGALGSSLVNMLYVLDEPTAGLHPDDVRRLSHAIGGLRARGNTVVIVEHDEQLIRDADEVVEIGPAAGTSGGRLVFQGTPEEMASDPDSLTGQYLSGRRGYLPARDSRRSPRGKLVLKGAAGHNLQGIDVSFPLGVLCLVTGVSGSGKSSLVHDTLYGALCRQKRRRVPPTLPYKDLVGAGQIEDVMLVDQSPISRSARSIPATFVKAFDPIRAVFADTVEARTRNLTAGHFSFNNESGRCSECEGDGIQQIDMQFLADIAITCSACGGSRYRREILEVRYRDRTIAEVLEMTVQAAHGFFRGHAKVQAKLKRLIDVGLGYIALGQRATTLSSGEAQRMKLAAFLTGAKRRRTLFILDEPSTGLHFADNVQLLDCFDALLEDGHSLVVVEHNVQLMQAADYIIDLGPGAADQGGQVVAEGTPEEVAEVAASVTGRVLAGASVA